MKKFLFSLFRIAVLMFSSSWVLYKFWNWFIEKQFSTIHMTLPIAVGVITVASFIQLKMPSKEEREKILSESIKDHAVSLFYALGVIYFNLLIGYLVHLFVI